MEEPLQTYFYHSVKKSSRRQLLEKNLGEPKSISNMLSRSYQ